MGVIEADSVVVEERRGVVERRGEEHSLAAGVDSPREVVVEASIAEEGEAGFQEEEEIHEVAVVALVAEEVRNPSNLPVGEREFSAEMLVSLWVIVFQAYGVSER